MPLHPAAVALLNEIAENDPPSWSELQPSESRAIFGGFTDMFGEGPELSSVEDLKIDGHLPARLYRPTADEELPGIMFFHGGGWVLGNIETHDALCRRLAWASRCAVLAVDYRLAPEHPYPAALEDCYRATDFVAREGNHLGLRRDTVALVGDSAGGNLAAAVALKARDESGPKIACQALIYPVIQPNFETDSYRAFGSDYMLTRESMEWFWRQYLNSPEPAELPASPYAALMGHPLSELPPTFILTAEYDILRTEGEQFADKLAEAGNRVSLQQFDGMLHGFVHFGGIFEDGRQAVEQIGEYLRSFA